MTITNYLKQMNEQMQFEIERGTFQVKQYPNKTLEIDSQCTYKEEFIHLQNDFNIAKASFQKLVDLRSYLLLKVETLQIACCSED